MSTPEPPPEHAEASPQAGLPGQPTPRNRLLYGAIALVVLALVVVGLFTYRHEERTKEAERKADDLTAALQRADLPVPVDEDTLISVLGDDGGAICESPSSALTKAYYDTALANGAATVGIRPITVDRTVVEGETLVIRIYCPDELEDFNNFVEDKDFDSVIRK